MSLSISHRTRALLTQELHRGEWKNALGAKEAPGWLLYGKRSWSLRFFIMSKYFIRPVQCFSIIFHLYSRI